MRGKLRRVEVTWGDAVEISGWHPIEEIKHAELVDVISIGYVLDSHNPKILILGRDLNDQGQVGGITFIPRSWIKKIKRIR